MKFVCVAYTGEGSTQKNVFLNRTDLNVIFTVSIVYIEICSSVLRINRLLLHVYLYAINRERR